MSRPTHVLMLALMAGAGACAVIRPEPEIPPEQNAAHRLERSLARLNAGLYHDAFADLSWVYSNCAGHEAASRAAAVMAAIELDPRNRHGRPGVGVDLLAEFIRDPGRPEWAAPLAESSYLMARALGAPPAEGEPPPPVIEEPEAVDSAGTIAGQSHPDTAAVPVDSAESAETAAVAQPTDTTVVPAESTAASIPGAETSPRAERVRAEDVLPGPAHEAAYGCGAAVDGEGWIAPKLPAVPGPSLVTLLARAEAERDAFAIRADTLAVQTATLRRRLEETQRELERIRRTLRP